MKLRAIKDKKKIEAIFEKGLLIKGNGVSLRFYDFNNNECFRKEPKSSLKPMRFLWLLLNYPFESFLALREFSASITDANEIFC